MIIVIIIIEIISTILSSVSTTLITAPLLKENGINIFHLLYFLYIYKFRSHHHHRQNYHMICLFLLAILIYSIGWIIHVLILLPDCSFPLSATSFLLLLYYFNILYSPSHFVDSFFLFIHAFCFWKFSFHFFL